MRIAILDDEKDDIRRIQELICNIQGDYRVDQYLEGTALLGAVAGGESYDLLICDIYMKNESGIEVAKKLREINSQTPIVFITNSQEHAVEAFSLRALHYLVKPVCQEDINEVFRRMKDKRDMRHTLTIQIDRVFSVLFQDEIIRVESHGHSTIITCINDTVYSIRKPYREITALLDDTFLQIKRGVTLNMRHITRMTYRDCATRDGSSYLLRREQAKEIRERYLAFWETELKH